MSEMTWFMHKSRQVTEVSISSSDVPVVVIDLEDREQVERLIKAYCAQWNAEVTVQNVDTFQAALRAYAEPPKPYREWKRSNAAPWPKVAECFSSHIEGHECPQCSWVHGHDWVAWTGDKGPEWPPRTVPIRCSKCGGRKCDLDLCAGRRHDGHGHQDGAL